MLEYINIYFSRTTVVIADLLIFALAAISIFGIVVLRKRVDDLNIAIQQLQNRITKGRDNS